MDRQTRKVLAHGHVICSKCRQQRRHGEDGKTHSACGGTFKLFVPEKTTIKGDESGGRYSNNSAAGGKSR